MEETNNINTWNGIWNSRTGVWMSSLFVSLAEPFFGNGPDQNDIHNSVDIYQ